MHLDAATTEMIIHYRYWILIPLSFIEGPIVAFVAGTLASLGYFNPYALAAFFFVRDVSVDLFCYWVGFYGGQTSFVKRLLRRMGVSDAHLEDIRKLWHVHAGKTMFLSKLSYGVAAGFIVVAGMVKMPLKKFIGYGSLMALIHYCLLVFLGYFFGNAFGGTITGILEKIPYVIGGLSIIALAYYFFKRYMSKKLEEAEKEVESE